MFEYTIMNYSVLKKSIFLLRIQCKNVPFKRIGTSNIVGFAHTVPTAPEVSNHTKDKSKQNPLKNDLRERKQSSHKKRTDTVFSSFLVSNKNNPDVFGSLTEDWKMYEQLKKMPDEKDDVVETEFLYNKEGKTRLTINQYGRIMKKFIDQKKVSKKKWNYSSI